MQPQSIGILGGTFNPIHTGHIRLARYVRENLRLDQVLIIPDRIPPHTEADGLLPGKARLELCRIACGPYPELEVSDMELKREGPSYTVDTLTALKEQFPGAEFTLIVGSDMFLTIDTWKNSGEIFKLARICTGAREKADILRLEEKKRELERLGASCVLLDLPVFQVSSTQLRRAAALGADIDYLSAWMPEGAARTVLEREYYQSGEPEKDPECLRFVPLLKERLSPRRLFHCRCVADMSQEMAERFFPGRVDPKRARLAGLLHDICREEPGEAQLALIRREGLEWDPTLFETPSVWHGFAGAVLLKERFGILDEELLNAIRYHTTGRKDMSPLEKIVFLADAVSIDRLYPGAAELREASRDSVEEGVLACLQYSIAHLAQKKVPIGRYTWEAFNQAVSPKNKNC